MFRSIRWRLVASYVLLTLLTVSIVGALALSLIQRYVRQQEQDYLTANAEAVARQALPMMQPLVYTQDLLDLARTASFLGNVQVRILDDQGRILADSGQPAEVEEFVWIVTPEEVDLQSPGGPFRISIMAVPSHWPAMEEIQVDPPFPFFESMPSDAEITLVRRTDGFWGQRFIFGTRRSLEVIPALPRPDPQALTGTLGGQTIQRSQRVVTAPIGQADEPVGYVELSKGPDAAAEALATARQAFLLAASGATVLAAIVGLLVSRGLTAPLSSLATAAGQMSGGDLSIRAPVRGRDEIGQLARQFNHMAERLQASFAELAAERDSLRRFIADASHELRTPITALKNFNELLQGAAADDPAARAEFLAESQAQLRRLEWITHNLLDLSRLEAGLAALEMADHDAGEMIASAAAAFRTLADEKSITLSVAEPPSPMPVRCDRARIEMALSNLLDNALKFTPPGGQVQIGAEAAGQNTRLWVQDSGLGIPPADQPRVFERFYRGQDGRVEGTGLGLAIVRSIVEAHGGQVAVESTPGAGSRFLIELPLTGQDQVST